MGGEKAGKARNPPGAGGDPAAEAETSFELVKRARAGDRIAEERLFARYLPRLQRWARGRLPRGARPALDTGDVVQEVLSRAIRSFATFEAHHEGSFPAFLRTILTNRLHDLERVDQRRPPPRALETGVDDPVSPAPSPLDLAEGSEQRQRFDAAMQCLKPHDQELIFMRMELGYTYDEMASMLGRSNANAIRIATRRAMLRLAAHLPADSAGRE